MYLKLAKFLLSISLLVIVGLSLHIERAAASIVPDIITAEIPASRLIELRLSNGPYISFSGNPGDFTISGVVSNPVVTGVTVNNDFVRLTLSQSIVATDIPKLSYSYANSHLTNTSSQDLQAFAPKNVAFIPAATVLSAVTDGADRITLNMLYLMSGYQFEGAPSAFTISGTLANSVTVTGVEIEDYKITLQLSNSLAYGDVISVNFIPLGAYISNGITNIAELHHSVINNLMPTPEIYKVIAVDSNSNHFFDTNDTIRITFNTALSSLSVNSLTALLESSSYDPLGLGRTITWSNSNQTIEIKLGVYDDINPLIQLGQAMDLSSAVIINLTGGSPAGDYLTVNLPAVLTQLPSTAGISDFSFTDLDANAGAIGGYIYFKTPLNSVLSYVVKITNSINEIIYEQLVDPDISSDHQLEVYSNTFSTANGLKILITPLDTVNSLVGLPLELPISDLSSSIAANASGMSVAITAAGGNGASLGMTGFSLSGSLTSGHALYASLAGDMAAPIPNVGATLPVNFPIVFSGGGIELAARPGNHVSFVEVDSSMHIVGYVDIVLAANQIGTAITSIADTAPILNYARNGFTLYFSSELDTEFALNAANFKIFTGSLLEVASVQYNSADTSHHTIRVELANALPVNTTGISLIMNSSSFKIIANSPYAKTTAIPLTHFNQIDLTGDAVIGIEDIVRMINNSSLQVDLNRDNLFNHSDIQLLLNQISPVS